MLHRIFVGAAGQLKLAYDTQHASVSLERLDVVRKAFHCCAVRVTDAQLMELVRLAVNGGHGSARRGVPTYCPAVADRLETVFGDLTPKAVLDCLRCCRNDD